jgi:hypothetical protein
MYDLKGQKFNVDDFSEILNYTSTNLYDTFITHLIKTDLIFELRVRILDDNNQFKLDEE